MTNPEYIVDTASTANLSAVPALIPLDFENLFEPFHNQKTTCETLEISATLPNYRH